MPNPIDTYWQLKLATVAKELKANNFEVFLAQTAAEAGDIIFKKLIPKIKPKVVSWGGSMTVGATGVTEAILKKGTFTVINPYEAGIKPEESYERRRQGLLADLFITGTNALTEQGQLVNLDATGNRVGAINFGPKNVILAVGRNKIVPDLEAAFNRVKDIAAPINAVRLGKKTPCASTAFCQDCKSPDRICNVWTVTEKSFPKGRIRIVLINQDLGY
jgi:L-lactate utilization protein LutB